MKTKTYCEPLAGGFACYSTTSGKIEMVGYQKPQQVIDERAKLADLVRQGCERLSIPVWTEPDEDYDALRITFGAQRPGWGIMAYSALGVDEDIDGTNTHYPAWEITSFEKDKWKGNIEEQKLTKRPQGLVSALRIILHWLYENHMGDPVECVVQSISPKE